MQQSGNTREDLEEARVCMKAGAPNATAMMCRRVISHLAVSNGADDKSTTGPQLRHLRDNNIIGEDVFEAARRVKALGDEGAHPPEVVTPDEAREALDITERIMKAVSEPQQPGQRK